MRENFHQSLHCPVMGESWLQLGGGITNQSRASLEDFQIRLIRGLQFWREVFGVHHENEFILASLGSSSNDSAARTSFKPGAIV